MEGEGIITNLDKPRYIGSLRVWKISSIHIPIRIHPPLDSDSVADNPFPYIESSLLLNVSSGDPNLDQMNARYISSEIFHMYLKSVSSVGSVGSICKDNCF